MSQSLSQIHVLVPGNVHAHIRRYLTEQAQLHHLTTADPALLTPQLAESVRAIATREGISAAFMDALPHLEIIAGFGVGYDAIDAEHAARKGIIVTNTPDVLTAEVADTALALLLITLRDLSRAEQYLRAGRWVAAGPFPPSALTLRERRIGIHGLGRIGRAIAQRLQGFEVDIAYHSRHRQADVPYTYCTSLQALAHQCDTLINVVPGGAATHHAIDAVILRALGPQGVLINIGRGSTVDTKALVAALHAGTIAAAGLDVYPDEPHVPPALLDAPHTVLLPHVGSSSAHTRKQMAQLVVDNLEHYFTQGTPLTPVRECVSLSS